MICNTASAYGSAVSAILTEFSPFNTYDELPMVSLNPTYGFKKPRL